MTRVPDTDSYIAVIEECCHCQKSDVGEHRKDLIDKAIADAVQKSVYRFAGYLSGEGVAIWYGLTAAQVLEHANMFLAMGMNNTRTAWEREHDSEGGEQ